MTLYNVLAGAVECIEAESPEQARKLFDQRLTAAGFEPHDLVETGVDAETLAFESEDQAAGKCVSCNGDISDYSDGSDKCANCDPTVTS